MTTLGRGGSDLTATTIGKALGLREIQVWGDICFAGTFSLVNSCIVQHVYILHALKLFVHPLQVWKDVDGVLTCDPNIYKYAEPVPYLTFDEAAELAYFGAQVLYYFTPFNSIVM